MLNLFIAEIMGKRMFFGEIFVLKLCATDMEYSILSCCYGWPAIKNEIWCNQTSITGMIIATSDPPPPPPPPQQKDNLSMKEKWPVPNMSLI